MGVPDLPAGLLAIDAYVLELPAKGRDSTGDRAMTESTRPLTTKNRPSRNDYPLTPAGDLGFAQALVVWQRDELDRLTAEVAELRRDAERWLCANNFDKPSTQIHTWLHTWEPHSVTGEPTEWEQRIRGGDNLDRVIDAARAALGEQP